MTTLPNFLLTFVIAYGAPFLALILLLGSLGIPMPATLLLVAAGAFLRQGILNWPVTILLALGGTIMGDSLSYAIGHFGAHSIRKRFGKRSLWLQAQVSFDRYGSLAIFLSRFFITTIAIPVNLIAGGSDYKFRQFLTFDTLGEIIWIAIYGGLGYFFGNEWETIGQFVSDFSGLTFGLVILGLGLYIWSRQRRTVTQKERMGDRDSSL